MLLICIHRVSLSPKKGLNMQSTCCIATFYKKNSLFFNQKPSSSCTTLHDNFIATSYFLWLVIFICDYILPCHDETINSTIKHSLMLPFFTSTSLCTLFFFHQNSLKNSPLQLLFNRAFHES